MPARHRLQLPRPAFVQYALARLGRVIGTTRRTIQVWLPARVAGKVRIEPGIPCGHEIERIAPALVAPAIAGGGDARALLAVDDFHRAEARAHLEVVVLGIDLRFDAGAPGRLVA